MAILIHWQQLTVKPNQLASELVLYVDGVAIELFSRLRDFYRRSRWYRGYAGILAGLGFHNCQSAWIENRTNGAIVERIVGSFPFA